MSSAYCSAVVSRHCRLLRKRPLLQNTTTTTRPCIVLPASSSGSGNYIDNLLIRQYSTRPTSSRRPNPAPVLHRSRDSHVQMEPKIHKLEPLEERQYEFLTQVGNYKNVWYPKNGNDNNEDPTSNNDVSPPLNSWKQATQFQHPSQATWEQLMQSEEAFARICTLCHELFVATASVTDADTLDWSTDFLTTILPFGKAYEQTEQTSYSSLNRPQIMRRKNRYL